jgi:hypothetical protein
MPQYAKDGFQPSPFPHFMILSVGLMQFVKPELCCILSINYLKCVYLILTSVFSTYICLLVTSCQYSDKHFSFLIISEISDCGQDQSRPSLSTKLIQSPSGHPTVAIKLYVEKL